MEPTRNTIIRNAGAVFCAGFIVIGGTIATSAVPSAVPPVITTSIRQFQDSDNGFSILKRMLEADAEIAVEGEQTTTLYHNGSPVKSEQHVLRDGSRGLRIVYTAPPKMANTVIVDNGNTLWQFNPHSNRLETSPSKLKKRIERYPAIMKARGQRILSVSIQGTATVAGRPCTIIQVERKKDPGPIRTFWVDDATGVQLQVQVQEHSGSLRSVTQYRSIAFNVPVPPGSFNQPNTPGAIVDQQAGGNSENTIDSAAKQAGFSLLTPGYLPPGFHFQSAQVTLFERRNMVHARYTDGINTLSIFQRIDRGRDTDITSPEHGVMTRIAAGHRLVVIANIEDGELRRVIQAMR